MWRRSLQLRVVTTTTVLTILVIAVLGNVLLARVRDGLLEDKRQAALSEAASGTTTAAQAFTDADRSSADYDTLAHDLVARLSSAGGPAGANDVALLPGPRIRSVGAPFGVTSRDMDDTSTIPADLRREVERSGEQQWTYCLFRSTSGETQPAIAIGSPVTIPTFGNYELYFVFPLDKENATLGLVRRALLYAALGLALLVGGIAWLVTRQVVTPVRMAARIAERLSAGRLEERMRVRGEDDLARLAASFNRMAISLQRQIRQLEDLSRVQRRFVSDVSHELRTPLTTVRMAADVLHEARGQFDPVVERSAEILQAQLDRFEALLADLLEISRYDAGAALLETEPSDLRLVVESVVEGMEQLAERRGSTLTVRAAEPPAIADVDSRRIQRILRNLLANAIEHGEGRPIEVYVASDENAVAIAVRDHGIGLAPGEAAMVFNRFWRADPARARTTGGTGLGLSISLEDAHLHGGWLQVWGEVGDGTQFRLTLPREVGSELERSPIPLEPMDSARRRRPVRVGDPYQHVTLAPTRGGSRAG
ncbi:MAG: two-component system, OmpR family, sensor histidine kinase MtrB [Actinomycetota bacterium]|jgi:two-component system sensor histidine kinase MtrB|nr:two-component system, OmpR family, sensor histidine kinase MtrB [Actinomycetota bacterium]